jgi:hypothetical protein
MRPSTLILLTLCWAGPAVQARADVIYQYVTDAPVYTATAPGQTITANLYLQETLTGTSTSLIAPENGLDGAGLFVTPRGSLSSNGTTIASILGNTQPEPAGFNGFLLTNASTGHPSTTQAWLVENVSANDLLGGPSGTTAGGSGSGKVTRVLLGQLLLTPGGRGTSTTFLLESFKNVPLSFGGLGTDGNTLSFTSGYDLDVTNSNPNNGPFYTGAGSFSGANAFAFTVQVSPQVAAVPEPSSLALFLAAASGMSGVGAWRHSRNRRKARA